jgi:iron complex transport system ATP-binding protein
MPDQAFIATGLRYTAGGSALIKEVDLSGAPGEVIAVLGPNGAGKSTLLRLLAGDLRPDSGSIRIGDLTIDDATPVELAKVRSVMRQGGNTDIPFTALAVVEMGRYPHRNDPDASLEKDRAAIQVAMERTDTIHLAGRVFATLSGGEQTRVVMARIMAQESPVVFLDEPTTALDVAHQERVLREIRRLAADGRCVVAVFHDLNAASFYADRIVLMANGEVRAEGTPTRVLHPDLLGSVYRQPMVVQTHPTRGCPLVLTVDEDGGLSPPRSPQM